MKEWERRLRSRPEVLHLNIFLRALAALSAGEVRNKFHNIYRVFFIVPNKKTENRKVAF
jgi:hypothetical protein